MTRQPGRRRIPAPAGLTLEEPVPMAEQPENPVHPATRDEWRAWLEAHHSEETARLAAENVRANQWRPKQ